MLLFDVGVECRIGEISLNTVVAREIATLDVIFRPFLALLASIVAVIVEILVRDLLPCHVSSEAVLATCHDLLVLVAHLLVVLAKVVLSRH